MQYAKTLAPGATVRAVFVETDPARTAKIEEKWQHIFHNQTALLITGAVLFRRNTVVADVPYLLKRWPVASPPRRAPRGPARPGPRAGVKIP